jgi:hypothetical protein
MRDEEPEAHPALAMTGPGGRGAILQSSRQSGLPR